MRDVVIVSACRTAVGDFAGLATLLVEANNSPRRLKDNQLLILSNLQLQND